MIYLLILFVYFKGEKKFNSEDERLKFIADKKHQFFLGNEIDPETIYINDDMTPTKHATYVDRKKINELKIHIENKSKKKEFYNQNKIIQCIEPICVGCSQFYGLSS